MQLEIYNENKMEMICFYTKLVVKSLKNNE